MGSYRTIRWKEEIPEHDERSRACAQCFGYGRAAGVARRSVCAGVTTGIKLTAARGAGRRPDVRAAGKLGQGTGKARKDVRIIVMRSELVGGENGSAWRIKLGRLNRPVSWRWRGRRQRPWWPQSQRFPSRRKSMKSRRCGWRSRSDAWCAAGSRSGWCGGRHRNGGGRCPGIGDVEGEGGRP